MRVLRTRIIILDKTWIQVYLTVLKTFQRLYSTPVTDSLTNRAERQKFLM